MTSLGIIVLAIDLGGVDVRLEELAHAIEDHAGVVALVAAISG